MTECYDCGEPLEANDAFECKHCGEEYCADCLKDHGCHGGKKLGQHGA